LGEVKIRVEATGGATSLHFLNIVGAIGIVLTSYPDQEVDDGLTRDRVEAGGR